MDFRLKTAKKLAAFLLVAMWPFIVVCAQDSAPTAAVVPANSAASPAEPAVIQLIALPLDENWKFFCGKKDVNAAETWEVKLDAETSLPMLVCKGEPYGYIRTKKAFRDFELNLEWRYPSDANGNSGVLVHTAGEDRIWPTCLQVQLHQPETGSIFPSGAAKTDNELRNVPQVSKPVNQWNACQITSKDRKLVVSVNGHKIGEVTGCDPREGGISLQSEGSVIHFRRIELKDLSSPGPSVQAREGTGASQDVESAKKPETPAETTKPTTSLLHRPHGKRKTPLATRLIRSQAARGEKRLNAEWVRLQSRTCEDQP